MALTLAADSGAAASITNDAGLCRQNLRVVFDAIQAYRVRHHRLPDDLSELVPNSLPRADRLICPVLPRRVDHVTEPREGVVLRPGFYVYEFSPHILTNDLALGLGATLRAWRQWQLGRVGSGVPIVRCTNHSPILNLSFGGDIYESGPEWEEHFSPLVKDGGLSLETLLSENMPMNVVRIPARHVATPTGLIDLTKYYNGSLSGWLEGGSRQNLAELPAGPTTIADIQFDVRGVIQLGSRIYSTRHRPESVSNIVVELRCREIVFLHATVHAEVQGTVIGRYVMHSEDGTIEVLPITYGEHVLDWRADPEDRRRSTHNDPVWSGSGRTERRRNTFLYAARWQNPKPAVAISHIDFISAMTESSPFLVAISAEVLGQVNFVPKSSK